jgi:uncharacterized protein (TIGR00255 family)
VLLSMTGFGDGSGGNDRLHVAVEVRSVNNKHLKISVRAPEAYLALENDIEKLVRGRLGRGTVTVSVRVDRIDGQDEYAFNPKVLRSYSQQLRRLGDDLHLPAPADLSALLPLPGVIVESESPLLGPEDWPVVESAVSLALDKLDAFRATEGAAMAGDMATLCDALEQQIQRIQERRPQVTAGYRQRLQERVAELLAEFQVTVDEAGLVREVALFAERCDINEELTRLSCHVDQVRAVLDSGERAGRKLEFLCQEMFREINTIGSKANDVEIAHRVVDAKAAVERMREMVQNIE